MKETIIRGGGLVFVAAYGGFIAWLYAAQPTTIAEVRGGISAAFGAYQIDPVAFADGQRFFANDQFVEAREAFARADPAIRDARTQFYIAYAYYRQGWHRLYHDDELYRAGLRTITRAIALSPDGHFRVDDPALGIQTAGELRAELEAGLRQDLSDLNPLRVLRPRK